MEKLKLMTIVGTRPEIIRLSSTIKACDQYFNQILVHTGQNYDYTLNQIFFDDLEVQLKERYSQLEYLPQYHPPHKNMFHSMNDWPSVILSDD